MLRKYLLTFSILFIVLAADSCATSSKVHVEISGENQLVYFGKYYEKREIHLNFFQTNNEAVNYSRDLNLQNKRSISDYIEKEFLPLPIIYDGILNDPDVLHFWIKTVDLKNPVHVLILVDGKTNTDETLYSTFGAFFSVKK